MRLYQHQHPYLFNKSKPVIIYAFADTHIGSINFDEDKLREHIKRCKKENAYWVHLGDWCEAITPKDRRFDTRFSTLNHITEQYELAAELFSPISSKCIGVIAGNHDEKISKDTGDLLKAITIKPLNITNQYLGTNGFVSLRLRRQARDEATHTISIYMTHGYGKGRLIGSKAIQLQRLSHSFDANLYLVGHLHTSITHTDEIIKLGRKHGELGYEVVKDYRHYIAVPSYFDAYMMDSDSYAEKGAYPPQPTGCERIVIEDTRKGDLIGFNISSRTLYF